MLIIGNNNVAVTYDKKSTDIKVVTHNDGTAQLVINNIVFASSDNSQLIHILYWRLLFYCERYRRKDDTFDMKREIKIINKEIKRGKYVDYTIHPATARTKIGYPTYTS